MLQDVRARGADADPVIQATGLVKRFGAHTAVDGLSLSIGRGECFGLLGPNGAGKSTTLRLLLGQLDPDAGDIRLLGHPVPGAARAARARVGVVPQADMLDPDFTVAENLLVYGRYFRLPDAVVRGRIDGLLDFAGLAGKRDARIGDLSGGMRRRLVLARALVNDPEILFLDEPTTGLDPQARHLIWERLRRLLAQGRTIVLTTHFMDEAERLATRLAVIDRGRSIATGSPAELIRRWIEPHVVEVHGEGTEAWALGDGAATCTRVEHVGETVFGYCADPAPALASLAAYPALRVLNRPANLEDVFLKLTGRDLRD